MQRGQPFCLRGRRVSLESRIGRNRRTLRESSSLVGADVGDSSECLEGVELADNDVPSCHRTSSSRESDREDNL